MSASTEHLGYVSKLAKKCESWGLTFFEHQYNYNAFGSWLMIVGKSKDRMKFTWDGKDSYLAIEVSSFQNNISVPSWQHIDSQQHSHILLPDEVFQVLDRSICERYGI